MPLAAIGDTRQQVGITFIATWQSSNTSAWLIFWYQYAIHDTYFIFSATFKLLMFFKFSVNIGSIMLI
jgi:hypothetical protein